MLIPVDYEFVMMIWNIEEFFYSEHIDAFPDLTTDISALGNCPRKIDIAKS
jgi:hypothetical protein